MSNSLLKGSLLGAAIALSATFAAATGHLAYLSDECAQEKKRVYWTHECNHEISTLRDAYKKGLVLSAFVGGLAGGIGARSRTKSLKENLKP